MIYAEQDMTNLKYDNWQNKGVATLGIRKKISRRIHQTEWLL